MTTLLTLATSVLTNVGAGGQALDDAELSRAKVHINFVYRYDVPLLIGGESSEAVYTITTADTDDGSYQLAESVAAVTSTVWRDDTPIDTFRSSKDFYEDRKRLNPDRGTPDRALLTGRQVYVRPLPDAVYTLFMDCIYYRGELAADTDTILDAVEQKFIEAKATEYYAREIGDFELAQAWRAFAADARGDLKTQNALTVSVPVKVKDF